MELSTTEEVEGNSVLLYNIPAMKTIQRGELISIKQGCQQLKLEICGGREYKAEKDKFYRQVSAQLEDLDYRELYSAYSGMIRKSQIKTKKRSRSDASDAWLWFVFVCFGYFMVTSVYPDTKRSCCRFLLLQQPLFSSQVT